MHYILSSKEETIELGKKISKNLKGGELILLNGEVGAGKTTLTKGIAAGLGITTEVNSPTFTLLNIYSGRLDLYHFDLFRLENIFEAEEAGLTEFFGKKSGVCVIEWADSILSALGALDYIRVDIRYVDENTRIATLFSSLD